jgi:hypothetical protein
MHMVYLFEIKIIWKNFLVLQDLFHFMSSKIYEKFSNLSFPYKLSFLNFQLFESYTWPLTLRIYQVTQTKEALQRKHQHIKRMVQLYSKLIRLVITFINTKL